MRLRFSRVPPLLSVYGEDTSSKLFFLEFELRLRWVASVRKHLHKHRMRQRGKWHGPSPFGLFTRVRECVYTSI